MWILFFGLSTVNQPPSFIKDSIQVNTEMWEFKPEMNACPLWSRYLQTKRGSPSASASQSCWLAEISAWAVVASEYLAFTVTEEPDRQKSFKKG